MGQALARSGGLVGENLGIATPVGSHIFS